MNKAEEPSNKRNKSTKSNGSNARKKDKYYASVAKSIDKRATGNNLNKNDLNNQFIEIVKNLNSPNQGVKSHNHSHSEVYSQKPKKEKFASKRIRTKNDK